MVLAFNLSFESSVASVSSFASTRLIFFVSLEKLWFCCCGEENVSFGRVWSEKGF